MNSHMLKLTVLSTLMLLLCSCGPRIKSHSLVSFEQQKLDQSKVERLQKYAPDLFRESIKYYERGLEEHEDNEPEASNYYLTLAQITWQTAERRSMYIEHQAKMSVVKQRLISAQALLNEALEKKRELVEMRSKQSERLQAQLLAQQSSKQAQDAAQAKEVETALIQAKQRRDDAVKLMAPKLVAGLYKKGEMALRSAESAAQRGDFINAARIAQGAKVDFDKAIEAAQPLFEAEKEKQAQKERIQQLLRESSQISGVDAAMEVRGVVVTLQGSFRRGRMTPRGKAMVAEMAELVSRYKELRIIVEGHTTSHGKRKKKLAQSEQMANQVKSALIARTPDAKVTALGQGDYAPITANPKSPQNERVDIVFVKPRGK